MISDQSLLLSTTVLNDITLHYHCYLHIEPVVAPTPSHSTGD